MYTSTVDQLSEVVKELNLTAPFQTLLLSFITVKAEEASIWAEITRHTHYLLGGESPTIDRMSAVTEVILLSLDIVDDLQDQDNMDKPWMRCPHEYSLNAVLALLVGAIGEVNRVSKHFGDDFTLFGEISHTIMQSINGQYKDISGMVSSESDYIEMVQEKSGSLIRLAMQLGCIGVTATQEILNKLYSLANLAGITAQLDNDLRDVLRFDLKNDLLQKKRTLPIQFLLMDDEEPTEIIRDFYEDRIPVDVFLLKKREIIQSIEDSGCIEYIRVIQRLYSTKAEQLLESIEAAPHLKDKLHSLLLVN